MAPLRPGLQTSLFEQLIYPLLDPQPVPHQAACDAQTVDGMRTMMSERAAALAAWQQQEGAPAAAPWLSPGRVLRPLPLRLG